MICAVPGTTGSWLQNPRTGPPSGHGNAGKISIEKIHFYGGKCSGDSSQNSSDIAVPILRTSAGGELGITAGIDLGGGDGGWGDYSDLRDLEVSGLPNAVGIKLQVNVSVLYNCWTEQTRDGILNANEGPGASCLMAFGVRFP